MAQSRWDAGDVLGGLYMLAIVGVVVWAIGAAIYDAISADSPSNGTVQASEITPTSNSTGPAPAVITPEPTKVTCIDVTSYDYNWNNDMKCTNPDGTVFYTDYSGASVYGY